MLIVIGVILGLAIGSFLNVVVWRVPRGESVAHPPSACPRCGHRIRARDNVPVLSWLVLRGRCRDCGNPISLRYPLVEAGTGVAFGLVAWWLGWSWAVPAFWYLAAVSIALTLIDLDVRRLPDAIVLPSWVVGLVLLTLAAWNPGGDPAWWSLVRAMLGALAMGASYFLILFAYPQGMGFGDVKLAVLLGLYLGWVGWSAVVIGWFAGFLIGGLIGVVMLLTRRAGRRSKLAFGPWMLVGGWVGLAAGPSLAGVYLGLAGL
ncbi:A24 family peptidase [Cellulomonas sp. RIT-PI-Y]|uniref:prepilin peptidase n=1 Tax=Cellulomonas sp. RIT-PI-Y TaxID=3035297 RepID=UPI0021D7EBD1|nr:A24 family peptidase [Cellulomonas sp. RIT-PI-Y]